MGINHQSDDPPFPLFPLSRNVHPQLLQATDLFQAKPLSGLCNTEVIQNPQTSESLFFFSFELFVPDFRFKIFKLPQKSFSFHWSSLNLF